MNWGLIPEVFYDLIARLVPGSLFLVSALAVHFGPKRFAELLAAALPTANLASLLLFGLLAYFVAIVLKEMWEFGARIVRGTATGGGASAPFLCVRSRMPAEASWLLKLQAEKNICEVLVPGLGILLIGDLWLIAARPSGDLTERIDLGVVLLVAGVACWRWRKSLDRLFVEGLAILQRLPEEPKSERPDGPVP